MLIFSKLKSYLIYIGAGLLAVLYFMFRVKSAQVDSLKTKAIETRLKAAEKQRRQADRSIEALTVAKHEGEKRIEQVKQDIAKRKPISFN